MNAPTHTKEQLASSARNVARLNVPRRPKTKYKKIPLYDALDSKIRAERDLVFGAQFIGRAQMVDLAFVRDMNSEEHVFAVSRDGQKAFFPRHPDCEHTFKVAARELAREEERTPNARMYATLLHDEVVGIYLQPIVPIYQYDEIVLETRIQSYIEEDDYMEDRTMFRHDSALFFHTSLFV